ncbi:MAG: hypothetical protein AABZ30_06760 [Myxococcota bacterium]
MPRPKKSLLERVGAADLAYAIDRLIAAGKATADEVIRYASERPVRIAQLRRELAALMAGNAPAITAPIRRGPGRPPGRTAAAPPAAPKAKRTFTMTPKMRAARKVQGQYLGALRSLDEAGKAAIKKIAHTQGVAAAVKAAKARKKS